MKVIASGVGPPASERSAHVSPRSDDRKRRVPPTSAQTTVLDGALSCAVDGNAIGVADAAGESVGVATGVGDAVGEFVGEGLGDAAAFGCVVHAVRKRVRRSKARIGCNKGLTTWARTERLASPRRLDRSEERRVGKG